MGNTNAHSLNGTWRGAKQKPSMGVDTSKPRQNGGSQADSDPSVRSRNSQAYSSSHEDRGNEVNQYGSTGKEHDSRRARRTLKDSNASHCLIKEGSKVLWR